MDLIERNGFFWPADDSWCHKVIHEELSDLDSALRYCKARELAVQAGGNVGVWAAHLARTFKTVDTVEPDAANYECLKRNVPPNVRHARAVFGDAPGRVSLHRVEGNAGAHYMGIGQGDISVLRIDDLGLDACDFLCLDVEGAEPLALKGAEQTIRKFRPVIMFEEKGLSQKYFGIARGAAEQWVRGLGLGYEVRERPRADVILTC